MFLINFKNYMEVSGGRAVELASAAASVRKRTGVNICVAPPMAAISEASRLEVPVFAQCADLKDIGSTTGYAVPELLSSYGARGSMVNHSEHRIPPEEIKGLVARLRGAGMVSVVCVRDVAETSIYAALHPDYIAIEPPELIGSAKAVSKERPELISEAAEAVKSAGSKTKLLCGAGITTAEDVAKALELGATGVLVASGVVKAKDWEAAILALAAPMA